MILARNGSGKMSNDCCENLIIRVNELEAILKDFLTTKECSRTWVDEMQGTIAAVLGEK